VAGNSGHPIRPEQNRKREKGERRESPIVSISREITLTLPLPSPQFIHSFVLTHFHVTSPLSFSLPLSLAFSPFRSQSQVTTTIHRHEGEGQREGDGEEEVSDRSRALPSLRRDWPRRQRFRSPRALRSVQ